MREGFIALSFMLLFALAFFPETVYGSDRLRVGQIPVEFLCLAAAIVAMSPEFLTRAYGLHLWALVLLGGGLLAVGIARGHEPRWIVIDGLIYSALLAGYAWGATRPATVVVRLVSKIGLMALVLGGLSLIGLQLGFILPSGSGTRVFNYSAFFAASALVIVLPLLYSQGLARGPAQGWRATRVIVALVFLFLVGLSTATRSLFVLASLTALAVLYLFARHSARTAFGCLGLQVVGAALLVAAAWGLTTDVASEFQSTQLGVRFKETDVAESNRLQEVQALLGQFTVGDYVSGQGFGGVIWTRHGALGPYVHAPHVGLMAYLQKGGAVLIVLAVVVPLFAAVFCVLSSGKDPRAIGVSLGVLGYCALSSVSGGWALVHILLFGIMLGASHRLGRRRYASYVALLQRIPPQESAHARESASSSTTGAAGERRARGELRA